MDPIVEDAENQHIDTDIVDDFGGGSEPSRINTPTASRPVSRQAGGLAQSGLAWREGNLSPSRPVSRDAGGLGQSRPVSREGGVSPYMPDYDSAVERERQMIGSAPGSRPMHREHFNDQMNAMRANSRQATATTTSGDTATRSFGHRAAMPAFEPTRQDTKRRRQNMMAERQAGRSAMASDLAEEVSMSAGIVVDYAERKTGAAVAIMGVRPRDAMRKLLAELAFHDREGYDWVTMNICRESLKRSLMEKIEVESKARGLYEKTTVEHWKAWGRRLKGIQREATCLDIDVTKCRMLWQLSRLVEEKPSENKTAKNGRVDEFWSAYSDRHRIISDKPAGRTPNGQVAWDHKPKKYGMAWDAKRGSIWTVKTPKQGTLHRAELDEEEKEKPEPRGLGYRISSSQSLNLDYKPVRVVSKPARTEELPPLQTRHRYLAECDAQCAVPMALPFMTGHSSSFDIEGRDIVDKDLHALIPVLEQMPCVEEVVLTGNALLTDAALARFLTSLNREEVLKALVRVDVAACTRAAALTVQAGLDLLASGAALRTLDISQVSVCSKLQLALGAAIGRHQSLETVGLAEIGLMPNDITPQVLKSVLGSRSLRSLDLSWNCFDGEIFGGLGEGVVYSSSLRTLKVAHCSAATEIRPYLETIPPLSLFIEKLSHDKTLTSLDISTNRCDHRTALILEDSLDSHRKLGHINLSGNPLGVLGMRSLLRLLSRSYTGLVSLDTRECSSGQVVEPGGLVSPTFSYTNPGGKYSLQLWRPYHRALLRLLYKTAENFDLPKEEAFAHPEKQLANGKLSPNLEIKEGYFMRPYQHPEKDNVGIHQVPETGDLSIVFSVERAIIKRFLGSKSKLEDDDNEGFLDRFYDEMRFKPSFKKVIPLFTTWKELEGDYNGQNVYLDALSKDFNLSLPYLQHLVRSVPTRSKDTIIKLQHTIAGNEDKEYLCGMMFRDFQELIYGISRMYNLIEFNPVNPTGNYRLELSNCSDFAVAERLMLLDRWEAAVDSTHGRLDVSQRGNWTHLRNPMYQGRDVHSQVRSVAEWNMPEHGDLVVDYMSNQRCPLGAEVLSDDLWESLCLELFDSSCTNEDKITAMRSISHNFYISAAHMRSLIGYFATEDERAEIFITFFLRIKDLHNSKKFRVRFESKEEITRLEQRLGYVNFFPFFQPENCSFSLDLSVNDQRLCASMYVSLAAKEKFTHNLHDYKYKRPDGTYDDMALGVPRSWMNFDSIPKDGVFSATYMCGAESRNLQHRKEIGAAYGFLRNVDDLTEDDVEWWTGLMEPPEDVINLLEYFISRYDDVNQAFKDIDGVDGNGVITLKELIAGLDEMGCTKFDKKKGSGETRTKEQRIDAIFRYLDLGSEGSVSIEEWGVLGQLWCEFDMSIREFVHFLNLAFGPCLEDAWNALDEDGSGEMDEEEWLQAIRRIGYFGPGSVVFALLDASDDGNISFDEFAVLHKYVPAKYRSDDIASVGASSKSSLWGG